MLWRGNGRFLEMPLKQNTMKTFYVVLSLFFILTKSATERYHELLNARPELVQQIPVHLIAKYLGIEPESLSRIRKLRM